MTEAEKELLKRITADPKIFGGKPIVRGMRISVEMVVSLLAQGETIETILKDVDGIQFIRFTGEDIVRHSLVQKILQAYDAHEKIETD